MHGGIEKAWGEAHFYLIKTLQFVVTGSSDVSAERPYMASCSTPACLPAWMRAIYSTHTHTHKYVQVMPDEWLWGGLHWLSCSRFLLCWYSMARGSLCQSTPSYISFRFMLWCVCVSTASVAQCNICQCLSVSGWLAAVQTLFGWSGLLLMWSVNESGQTKQTGQFFI